MHPDVSVRPRTNGFGKAVWSNDETLYAQSDRLARMLDLLRAAGFDLLIPIIKNPEGYVDYPSRLARSNPALEGADGLETLARACRHAGVRLHPWFCICPEGRGSALLAKDPDVTLREPDGSPVELKNNKHWVCVMRDRAQDYNRAIVREVLDRYDIDGIHLDYIRAAKHCYCGYCRKTVAAWTDLPLEQVYADRAQPEIAPLYDHWAEWRRSRVTDLVRAISGDAHRSGRELSAAVFTDLQGAHANQAQDWSAWGRDRLVDLLIPMNYTAQAPAFRFNTRLHVAAVGGTCPVWEGVSRASSVCTQPVEAVLEKARAAQAEGAGGITIFSLSALQESDILRLADL